MDEQVYITTSNGLYCVWRDRQYRLLRRRRATWFSRKRSTAFFGVDRWRNGSSVLAVARENLGTPSAGKPSTDARIFIVDPETLSVTPYADVRDVHDVHQVAVEGDRMFLTDTGKNRLIVFDLDRKTTELVLDVGPRREDVHHLNAVTVHDETLWLGLNNRGHADSQLLEMPLSLLEELGGGTSDLLERCRVHTLGGLMHTHDFEPFEDSYLVSASHDGEVIRVDRRESLVKPGHWVRGLAVNAGQLWVGTSGIAERSHRHREDLDGELRVYSTIDFQPVASVLLDGCGQVNDILALPVEQGA